MSNFTERLVAAIAECRVTDPTARDLIGRAIADTLAVAAAGAPQHVAQALTRVYAGDGPAAWSGAHCESREAALLLNGASSHALDFDDCYLAALIHPSTVILPAIFAGDGSAADRASHATLIDAFGAGLLAARAIAEYAGMGHYRKGWHGTGTIGIFAAAAAAARQRGLAPQQIRHALALAAAQAGGMHLNYGTWAKPSHAGFAAANGYRAVRMAEAGIDAAHDIFGKKGFADLYGTGDGDPEPGDDLFKVHAERIALKLFPSCYQSHRLIGLALDARAALGAALFQQTSTRMTLRIPLDSAENLLYPYATTGNEGKFSARFPIAAALADGPPVLAHFTDAGVMRADLVELGNRLEIIEDPSQPSHGDMEFGIAQLEVRSGNQLLGAFERRYLPGSPEDPPSPAALAAKFASCFETFQRAFGKPPPVIDAARSIPEVWKWLQLGVQ